MIDENEASYPKRDAFLRSTAPVKGFCTGRGAGKTMAGSLDLLLRAKDGDELMAVAPTHDMLNEATRPAFLELAKSRGVLIGEKNGPRNGATFQTTDGGVALVEFLAADWIATYGAERLRGPARQGAWFDEAGAMSHGVLQILIPRLRFGNRMGFLSLTFTPSGKDHWTYGMFFDREGSPRPGRDLYQASTAENPFLPEGFAARMEPLYEGALRRQEIGGEFIDEAAVA